MKTYKIADCIFSIEDDFSAPIFYYNAEKFQCDNDWAADYRYHFFEVETLDRFFDGAALICETPNFHIFRKAQTDYRMFHERGYYFGVSWREGNDGYFAYLDEGLIRRKAREGHSVFMYLGIENMLMERGVILLHASFIRYEDKAVLFTAPSGTGKSTQASLWETYASAQVINGDRAAIGKRNGRWMAYGLPMCGTSNIYLNASLPLKAIVVLRQAQENTVIKLPEFQAFKCIYSEISINNWDVAQTELAMETVDQLISEVPVHLLKCRIEEAAVQTLKQVLFPKQERRTEAK